MITDALSTFSDSVFSFITGEVTTVKGLLVKKHSENLQTHGDFSFPNTLKSWTGFVHFDHLLMNPDSALLQCISKESTDLIQDSTHWNLRVKNVKEENSRVHIFLERPKAIEVGLLEALSNIELLSQRIFEKAVKVKIDRLCEETNCITSLRVKHLSEVIRNLCAINLSGLKELPDILVSSKSSYTCSERRTVHCGAVLNAKTGSKETSVSADDFIRIRQKEMMLIAQHKYGVRVEKDSKWKEFISHLGESAVVFELLQIKPSSAVKINFDCSTAGSSKGAAFIFYNCARIETILRTYKDKVTEGIYPPLPEFEKTDFTLLTHEDEWCLIFNFIMGFPSLLKNCVMINEKTCEFRPHLICGYLCSMVRVFSQYYRKVRILTEPRKHLLPVIYARIQMLMSLNNTLKTCLNILNIKSVSQM